jgi:hypothetical protein
MQIKIGSEDLNTGRPQSEARSLQVEVVVPRGDTFNTHKVDTVLCDGEPTVFTVPDGGKLIISTPAATEELVYDKDQGAAIRKSQQVNDEPRADRAHETRERVEAGREPLRSDNRDVAGREPVAPVERVGSQGQDTRSAAERAASQPTRVTPPNVGGARIMPPQQPTPGAPNSTEAAKAAQADAPRPPGEKAPLPGSPVGSPPAGNEGKDNK